MNAHRSARHNTLLSNADLATEEPSLLGYANIFVLMAAFFVLVLFLDRTGTAPAIEGTTTKAQATEVPDATLQPGNLIEQLVNLPPPAAGDQTDNNSSPDWLATFRQTLKDEHLEHLITITERPEVTELSIASRVLFDAGEASLTRAGLAVLTELLPAITQTSGMVYIEGHTDNLPILADQFASNWELAAARASEVQKFFVAEGLAESRFRAVSFADTQPLAPNTNESNRQQNRRMNLVIHRHMKQ